MAAIDITQQETLQELEAQLKVFVMQVDADATENDPDKYGLYWANLQGLSTIISQILQLDTNYISSATWTTMSSEVVRGIEAGEDAEGNEGFTVTYWNGDSFFIKAASSGGSMSGMSGFQDADGKIHLTRNGEELSTDEWEPFVISGGGGGGGGTGSRLTVASLSAPTLSVLESDTEAIIRFRIASVDTETGDATGPVNVAVSVNNTVRENLSMEQGERSVDVRKYLTLGANAVRLTFTDSYGTTTSRSYTRNLESFVLEWNLSGTVRNTEESLTFYVTPTGSGTKTIYVYLDDVLYSTDTVTTSGRRLTKTITGLTHGDHKVEVYGELTVSGTILESNHLTAAVAQVVSGNTTPVIAVNWPITEVSQYTTISIEHMVIDPAINPTTVNYLVNDVIYATETIDQAAHSWSYRPMTAGTFKLGIMCGGVVEEKTITVSSIGSDVQEVTDGLEVKVDPSTMSNLEGWQYGNYRLTMSQGFDQVNGGLMTDNEGVHCIKIVKGDRLSLNYQPFADGFSRTGRALKVIYKVENCTILNAEAIKCLYGGVGFNIRANDVYCSGVQTTVRMDTCEDEKTELDIFIESSSADRLMGIWESCSTFAYNQYASGEDFTQATPSDVVFGSDNCDVILYLFRGYNKDLTDAELKANFAADGKDGTEILARYNRNQIYDGTGHINLTTLQSLCPNLHVMTWHSERFSLGKKDGVDGYLTHVYTAGGDEHDWVAYFTVDKVQGTSSVEHAPTAGGNQDFDMTQGIRLTSGGTREGYAMSDTAIPVSYFTFKKNIASQDHIINSVMSEWYQRFQPSVRAERIENPDIRDCMESEMAVLFFHNTGNASVQIGPDLVQPDETIFYGLGNLCNSKKNDEAFVYEPIVIEVKNNNEAPVRFKSDDLSDFDNNFEFRYLDEEQFTEAQAKALFQEFVTFVYSCDYTQATNAALPQVVNINGQVFTLDSAEYRKAKWKAEAWTHMDKASILYHQNFTLHYLGRDSRAKNMFWGYDPDTGLWDLRFLWDLDTFICVNNEGLVDVDAGHLDTDAVGTKDVFNAADNVIFEMNRQVFATDLREDYLARESAGAWNVDTLLAWITERQAYACESLWIEDVLHNNIRVLTNLGNGNYLPKATGKKRLLIKKYLLLQSAFIASYYNSTVATSDSVSVRGYTPSEWAGVAPSGILNITPYCNLFVNTHSGSTDRSVRAAAGETVQIDISATLNDTETYIRSAQWLQSLGDLSGLYIGECNLSNMKRATRFDIGSDVEGYRNTNFQSASFQNCKSLEYLNLAGLPNTNQAYDFSPNLMLKEIHTQGSGVTGLKFAKNGRLETAVMNAVASLYMSGLKKLQTFSMEGYEALQTLTIEDCPLVNSYDITRRAVNLNRVRLLDMAWSVAVAAYDVLMRLHNMGGIDDVGDPVSGGVLTGSVYFQAIGQTKYTAIREAIPTVDFTYGELVEEHTVTFVNKDGTALYTTRAGHGEPLQDPITAGLIPTPTYPSTVETVYTYYKWDTSLDAIVSDCTITATYVETGRTYTVNFIDQGTVIQTDIVNAHASTRYRGEDLERSGYIWTGWDASTGEVVADMDVNAVYIYPTLPASVKDVTLYDYAYSDDPNDTSAYTFGELYSIMKMGRTATYLPVTSKIKMVLDTDVIADGELVFNLHSIGHYALADGNGMSNGDWYMNGNLNAYRRMNPTNVNAGGWDECELRGWLNNTLFRAFPAHWRQLIARSVTLASAGNQASTIISSNDYLRIPSQCEVGFSTDAVPYINEVDSNAAELTFSQYTTNTSRIKKTFNNEGTAYSWWLRSAAASSTTNFCGVYANGTSSTWGASGTNGVCVGFSA